MIHHAFIIFSIFVSTAVLGEEATSPYQPTDVFLFNCGSTSDNVDENGRKWMLENQKILPSNSHNTSFSVDALYQDSGVPQVPYMNARIFQSDFTYSFPVSSGWKFIRLYFYPTNYGSKFDAVDSYFSVTVNRFIVLQNFSANLTARASKPESFWLIKEFIVPVNRTLNLTFKPSPNSLAFVNGIEIVSMPDRFYSKGGFDNLITNVDSNVIFFEINNSTALESVHRINVGGQLVPDVKDSGMFRRWLADDDFGNGGHVVRIPGVKINYTVKTPEYVAPEDVYVTSRSMGVLNNDPRLNLNYNMTWFFTVDAWYTYLIRLHFCETLLEVNSTSQRVFSILIGKREAKTEMDVIQLSGGSRNPVYIDFSLYVGFENGMKPDLQLDLHPLAESRPLFWDVILNGVEILKLSSPEGNLFGTNPDPIPFPVTSSPPITKQIRKGKKSHVLPIIGVGAVVGSAILLAMFVALLVIMKKKKKKGTDFSVNTTSKPTTDASRTPLPHGTGSTNTRSTISLPSDICRRFSISEIKSATNNFEDKLIVGLGGYGPVYKGRIDDGATLVAAKRLGTSSNQGVKEFKAEVKMLSVLRHVHLVSLIGYCNDEDEMVLVYEYMPHGTLKDHIYKRDKGSDPPLSWKRRLEICIGAALGLQYLHVGAKHPIIHRDIKTTNILLDENFVAKVSDFGLSRVGPTSASQTHVSTVVKGTFGYLDPEYYRRQVLTEKSDVYSFGVVLLEVLCCRPIKMQTVPPEQTDLIRWVKSNYKKGTVNQIIDQDLTADITSTSLEKFCEIAVRCVENRGVRRPSMDDVVWALEFSLQLHETAKKNNDNVDSLYLMPRGEEGMNTGHVANI